MADEAAVSEWLKSNEETHAVTPWMQLLATFPTEGAGRLPALLSRERKTGELTELQKAQIFVDHRASGPCLVCTL